MRQNDDNKGFVLQKANYILIAVGFIFILIGFILLSGGKSTDPNVFSEEIFNFRRITLAPIVIFLGFVIEIVAILYKPKSKKEE